MAWPTWMPLAARPANWIDWSTIFRAVIPREWPKRLFGGDSQAYSDLIAFGEALALARDWLSFLQNSLYPNQDSNGIFTARWERVYDVQPKGSITDRNNRLVALFRQRGTMTEDAVKAILCRAWDSDDPSILSFESPDPADVATAMGAGTTEWQWAQLQTQLHIYSNSAPTAEPDYSIIADLIAKIKPTWEKWTFGRYNHGKYEGSGGPEGGPGGGEGTYNHCTYA